MLAVRGHMKLGWPLAWNSGQVKSLQVYVNVLLIFFPLEIPVNEYYEYFGPDYELDVKSSNTDDLNTAAYLDRVKRIVMENLRHTGGPPSVQMSGKCDRAGLY